MKLVEFTSTGRTVTEWDGEQWTRTVYDTEGAELSSDVVDLPAPLEPESDPLAALQAQVAEQAAIIAALLEAP